MRYLEIHDDVPAAQIASADSVVPIDKGRIEGLSVIARGLVAYGDSSTDRVLADALEEIASVLAEVVRGLEHGRIAVYDSRNPDAG